MSFFGLTAFGPENFLLSSKVDSNGKLFQLILSKLIRIYFIFY